MVSTIFRRILNFAVYNVTCPLAALGGSISPWYDSVSGITKDARVYMIYDEAHKTYPAYVVNYQYKTLL